MSLNRRHKKGKQNGFILFAQEILSNSLERISLKQAIERAGPIWQEMTTEARLPYQELARAKVGKIPESQSRSALLEQQKDTRENKERNMKRQIESTVRGSVNRGEFEKQKYYFISANYFTHIKVEDKYVPAELSVCEFTLGDGVMRKYHTFVNPGVSMYGYMHDAKEYADLTHRLPIPPKAMGEHNLMSIYNDIIKFVGRDCGEISVVYTNRDSISIVESILKFLTANSINSDDPKLKVYSIQHLLFIMKEASCEIGEVPKIKTHHITDAFFEHDLFEYHAGLSCNYHEQLDKSKYCTQSITTRWGFMFCKYMCSDVAISLISGRHMPQAIKGAYAVTPGSINCKREYLEDKNNLSGHNKKPKHNE